MGLRCSHDAFHGAYSAFRRLRRSVAEGIGGSWPPHKNKEMDQKAWYCPIEFDRKENEGIFIFLNHSDCDGAFTPHESGIVARDLRKVLDSVSEEHGGGHLDACGGVRECLQKFIIGCESAAKKNEPLLFR